MSSYHLIFESLQEPIIVVDRDGLVRYGNAVASVLFDVNQRRLSSGRALASFITLDPDPIAAAQATRAEALESKISEVSFKLAGGQEGWVQVSVQAQPEFLSREVGAADRFIVSFRDVTLERTLHTKYRAELDQKEAVISDLREARAKLEVYSHQLEAMVEARTIELSELNRLFKTILDSLGQGILVVDVNGICLPVYSKACEKILGLKPKGLSIDQMLELNEKHKSDSENWRLAIFEDRIDFEDMVPLGLKSVDLRNGKSLSIDYAPMRNEKGVLQGIVMVVTDRTRERVALKRVEEERQFVDKILRLARNRGAFRMFLKDARGRFKGLARPETKEVDEILRDLHTIKGGASSFSLKALADACHKLEDAVLGFLSEAVGEAETRTLIDAELVSGAARLSMVLEDEVSRLAQVFGAIDDEGSDRQVELPISTVLGWSLQLLSSQDLKQAHSVGETIRRTAVEKPIGPTVEHYTNSLIDLAKRQGKQLSLFRIDGGSIRAPIEPFQGLLSSLVHALRNSIYHGLETPDERKFLKKPEGGTIVIRFARFEGVDSDNHPWLKIEISDDGRGIDPDKIRKKLVALGKNELAARPDDEVIQTIWLDQFSTNDSADDVAGRGVGMSAIAHEATLLGGKVALTSKKGQGTVLTIQVPFPMAWSELEHKILGAA